jgi:hypothetical protein
MAHNEMKRYNSKIGFGITFFIAAVLGIASLAMGLTGAWPGLVIIIIVAGFIVYVFRTTYYLIEGNQLIVKSGFMVNKTISIDRIFKIVETNNPLSAPAASLDRLAIYYNERDWIMISPKDKEGFIRHMTAIHEKINVVREK